MEIYKVYRTEDDGVRIVVGELVYPFASGKSDLDLMKLVYDIATKSKYSAMNASNYRSFNDEDLRLVIGYP